jgi:hypothetical protein
MDRSRSGAYRRSIQSARSSWCSLGCVQRARIGIRVRARKSETMTETESVMESARKNCPTTPESRPRGAKTTTVVRVEPITGATSSETALSTASSPSPRARWRWMFSTTTTASSMTRPMATASPPMDIRLIVSPKSFMKRKVEITVKGSVTAATSVTRQSRRKTNRTPTASSPPIRMASRTLPMASETKPARS